MEDYGKSFQDQVGGVLIFVGKLCCRSDGILITRLA